MMSSKALLYSKRIPMADFINSSPDFSSDLDLSYMMGVGIIRKGNCASQVARSLNRYHFSSRSETTWRFIQGGVTEKGKSIRPIISQISQPRLTSLPIEFSVPIDNHSYSSPHYLSIPSHRVRCWSRFHGQRMRCPA